MSYINRYDTFKDRNELDHKRFINTEITKALFVSMAKKTFNIKGSHADAEKWLTNKGFMWGYRGSSYSQLSHYTGNSIDIDNNINKQMLFDFFWLNFNNKNCRMGLNPGYSSTSHNFHVHFDTLNIGLSEKQLKAGKRVRYHVKVKNGSLIWKTKKYINGKIKWVTSYFKHKSINQGGGNSYGVYRFIENGGNSSGHYGGGSYTLINHKFKSLNNRAEIEKYIKITAKEANLNLPPVYSREQQAVAHSYSQSRKASFTVSFAILFIAVLYLKDKT